MRTEDYRIFRAQSSQQALRAARRELGEHVVIISSRTINNNSQSGKRMFEVTATLPSRANGWRTIPKTSILNDFNRLLELGGFSNEYRSTLVSSYLARAGSRKNCIDLELAAQALGEHLCFAAFPPNEKRILALVGPTGVGKTTTISKLAGTEFLKGNRSIGLITIDTYRIGGAEQLSSLVGMFGFPTITVQSRAEFDKALVTYADKQTVLIDTAGCGPRRDVRLIELFKLINQHPHIERMLLLPASGNTRDLEQVLSAFKPLGLHSMGITKTDETCYIGPCFNVLWESQLPIELITTGQQVPDDIETACANNLLRLLIRGIH